MFESGVEVCLQAQSADYAIMVAVNVSVDAIEAFEDGANSCLEIGWEWNAGMSWEDVGVGQVVRGPCQEVRDVGRSWQACGFGESWWVVP